MVLSTWNKIRKKQFAPVYLIYGTEQYIVNETKQLLQEHVLEGEGDAFNFSSYDLEETAIDVALEDAETLPFMGEKRLVVLQNPVFLTASRTSKKIEHNLEKLMAYMEQPAPYSILVFLAPYEKLDERRKITKHFKKYATLLEAKKLSRRELATWVENRVEQAGVKIGDDALNLLLTLVGDHLFTLASEVDKLVLFVGEERYIDNETVEKLVSRSLEQNIFQLVDHVVHRKIDEAFRVFYDLLKQNEEPIKMLSIITGQFRLIYQTKELSRRGYGEKQIAGHLKVHPYRVKLATGQARQFSDEELTRIIALLAESDYAMKTGGMDKQLLIEMFLFKLASGMKEATT